MGSTCRIARTSSRSAAFRSVTKLREGTCLSRRRVHMRHLQRYVLTYSSPAQGRSARLDVACLRTARLQRKPRRQRITSPQVCSYRRHVRSWRHDARFPRQSCPQDKALQYLALHIACRPFSRSSSSLGFSAHFRTCRPATRLSPGLP
jgi:hypothetical protein